MKKWILLASLFLVGIVTLLALFGHRSSDKSTSLVQLVLTGPEGQKFSGSYVADGKTNFLSGVVPSTIGVRVRQLTYDFHPEDARDFFYVVMKVDDANRISKPSLKGGPVKGGWERWHRDLRKLRDSILSGDIFTQRRNQWLDGEAYW